MEDMAYLWSFQESIEELKQKLLQTTLELETCRMRANEEMTKNNEYVKQLLQLLKTTCQERDEARDQLHKLLQTTKQSPNTSTTNLTISDTTDSIFEAVSSPEFSNSDRGNSGILPHSVDQGSWVVDSLVKGKKLPQKGKLLQAVVEAGPLLRNLLVAGPLPRWRNPPPPQDFHVPPFSAEGLEVPVVPANSQPYFEMSCGSSQLLSTSMLNFATAGNSTGACVGNGRLIPAGANSYAPSGKRQRFQ